MQKKDPLLSPKTIRNTLFITLCVLALLASFLWYRSHYPSPTQTTQEDTAEYWMNIFVHGTFGTALGFISMMDVIKDTVENTSYKKMIGLMRSDPYFYQMQPLQKKGLHPFSPSFDTHNAVYKYALYPIAAAYHALANLVLPKTIHNLYYSYGWSGLISQTRRRKEAIRFYNALQKEYADLHAKGITPCIRIIAHSHGGNVALNMAGVHELVGKAMMPPSEADYPDNDQRACLTDIYRMLDELKTKPHESPPLVSQKVWDVFPTVAPFAIDELVCLGTPIQPETMHFFFSPFFKTIYNVYSDDDVIQSMDWVSTRRRYSDKRVECSPRTADQARIVQVKLTFKNPKHTAPQAPTTQTYQSQEKSSLNTLISAASTIASRIFGTSEEPTCYDPLHKEFWFMGWKDKERRGCTPSPIYPYPYVILLPHIQHLINKNKALTDIDVRIKFKDNAVSFSCYPHNEKTHTTKMYLSPEIIAQLQARASAWQPDDISPEKEMSLLHAYSKIALT